AVPVAQRCRRADPRPVRRGPGLGLSPLGRHGWRAQLPRAHQRRVALPERRRRIAPRTDHMTTSNRDAQRRANIYGVILCQGASLTYGARDPDGMSYPLYLARRLSERHGQTWLTVNLGVPGECWAEIWRRNLRELRAEPEATEVCLWAGTNDAWKGRA